MEDKSILRAKAKKIRSSLDIEHISELITSKIVKHNLFSNSKNIMLYYPKDYEINLLSLLTYDKNYYLPRVNNKFLDICPYKIGDKLVKSKFGVMEPLTRDVNINILDLIIVPALLVDNNNYRLGYGKGFYDRLLSDSNIKTICPIPKALRIKSLPTDEFDIPVDYVITE